jgi:hypothetical protein
MVPSSITRALVVLAVLTLSVPVAVAQDALAKLDGCRLTREDCPREVRS